MRSVAVGRGLRLLAGADGNLLFSQDPEFQRSVLGSFVRSVAKRNLARFATTTPIIGSGLKVQDCGGLFHVIAPFRGLSAVRCLIK